MTDGEFVKYLQTRFNFMNNEWIFEMVYVYRRGTTKGLIDDYKSCNRGDYQSSSEITLARELRMRTNIKEDRLAIILEFPELLQPLELEM